MDELVQRLSKGSHPVLASRVKSAGELKQSIERGYVLIKFTDTQGGTELGLRLEEPAAILRSADYTSVPQPPG